MPVVAGAAVACTLEVDEIVVLISNVEDDEHIVTFEDLQEVPQ